MAASSVEGVRVFLVEDDEMLGQMIEDLLESEGCRVDRFTNLPSAHQALGSETFDVAVLDIHVQEGFVFSVADDLAQHRTPFLFVSGAHAELVPARHADRPLLNKPYRFDALVRCLQTLLERGS